MDAKGIYWHVGSVTIVMKVYDRSDARNSHAIRAIVEIMTAARERKPGFYHGAASILLFGRQVAEVDFYITPRRSTSLPGSVDGTLPRKILLEHNAITQRRVF